LAGKLAERALGIFDDHHGKRERTLVAPIDHRGGRAARCSGREEIVPIEALAAQRDEKLPAPDAAAVGRDAVEAGVGSARATAAQGRGFAERHHRCPRIASAARATASSENGRRWPAISW
jgi:hypothetical protein